MDTNLFGIADSALAELKNLSADMAYCLAAQSETSEFNVDGNNFSLFRTMFDNSLVLVAFKGGKKGTFTVNRFDPDTIKAAANECISAAQSSQPDDAWGICDEVYKEKFVQGALEPDTDRLFDRSKELLDDIKSRHPLITVEQMIVSHSKGNSVYKNSNGTEFETVSGKYTVSLMFSGHDGEKSSSFFGSGVLTDTLDRPFIELGSIEKDLSDVEKQIDTKPLEGKFTGTILLPPGCLGDFISSIAGNFASGGTLLEGTSIWKDKLGQKVADERISISLSPFNENIVCGERFTSEGFLSEDYDFIKDGVLNSFVLSLYFARKTGNERSKNQSGSFVMKAGDTPLEEIIKGIDKGIIVGRFSGGNPGVNGDFSSVAKNSFLIENGEITSAVSETMISGNLADLLNNVVAISKETVADGASVLPYAAFSGVTVSGK